MKITNSRGATDNEYLDFINQYYSAYKPNSVAMLERKYKILALERQSPITLESL